MIPANETFGGTWPFAPRFFDGNGFRMHYVDEGNGEPIVCLHGEPTWGYLYRRFIPPLAETNRIIVPDHMGFGKSQTPRDREYTLKAHVENLTGLIEALDLRNITFVIQDWGGPIGTAYTSGIQNASSGCSCLIPSPVMGGQNLAASLPGFNSSRSTTRPARSTRCSGIWTPISSAS
jgi:hypothetical protein